MVTDSFKMLPSLPPPKKFVNVVLCLCEERLWIEREEDEMHRWRSVRKTREAEEGQRDLK